MEPDADIANWPGATPSSTGMGSDRSSNFATSNEAANKPPSRPVNSRCPVGEYHAPTAFATRIRAESVAKLYTNASLENAQLPRNCETSNPLLPGSGASEKTVGN